VNLEWSLARGLWSLARRNILYRCHFRHSALIQESISGCSNRLVDYLICRSVCPVGELWLIGSGCRLECMVSEVGSGIGVFDWGPRATRELEVLGVLMSVCSYVICHCVAEREICIHYEKI